MSAKRTKVLIFEVDQEVDSRLDLWLSELTDVSRSQLKKLIDQGDVLVNGKPNKAGYKLQVGDRVEVRLIEEPTFVLEPEPIPLEIVYEDEDLAVINKPRDLVVHPAAGNWSGTLVNALLFHLDQLGGGSQLRPGIVHRLDKDTSGLMMVAKTEKSYDFLVAELKNRRVERRYLALVQGIPAEAGTIDSPLGRHPKDRKKMAIVETGREAQTHYKVVESFAKHSLVSCTLVTGRTHQIRVHLASIHHPIVGDPLYGFRINNLGAQSQVLQSIFLGFQHPRGNYLELSLDPDPWFKEIVAKARLLN